MAETTVQNTRKSIKFQQGLAFLTLLLGVGLIVTGVSTQEQGEPSQAMINGILTSVAACVWLVAMRLAKWWLHD